jgi:hypothetical protein
MITLPRIAIDRRRAARFLRDCAELLLAALPSLLGLLAGLVVRVGVWVWLAALWLLGAFLAGYDVGRGKH